MKTCAKIITWYRFLHFLLFEEHETPLIFDIAKKNKRKIAIFYNILYVCIWVNAVMYPEVL